jgi:hypothetical protein
MDEPIRDHIEAIATARDVGRLLRGGSPADRSHPAALEWVRRWRPDGAAAALPGCSCAAGRCALCN